MRGIKDGETGRRVQDIVMRYKYKVRELSKDITEDMEAMSFKKLKAKLDHKKEYAVEYTNKHGNYISTIVSGKEPK
jgi:aspartate aminotransferase-like enzyme